MKRKQVITFLLTMSLATGTLTGCGLSVKSDTSVLPAKPAAMATEMPTADVNEPELYDYESEATCEEAACEDSASDYMAFSESAAPAGNTAAYKEAATFDKSFEESGSYLDDIYGLKVDHDANSEEYSDLEEIGFKSTKRSPLSTFAADVDTASYSNMRRMIMDGYSLNDFPEGSIRIEELINYFNYDYKDPKGKEPFGVTTVIGDCPWNDEAKLLSIGLKTEDIDFADTPASNLVFLIDVSGSMFSDDKLPLLQDAFCILADQLGEKDRVSIVTYAGCDSVVLEGISGDQGRKIKRAINNLEAGGSTNGSAGIMTAYELAEDFFIKGGNNRVILATDGDLNVGLTSVGELEDLISEKKKSGVFLSVLGFGSGNIKDNKMETLADKGNGNYAYIDSMREAKKVLVKELSANMLTVCKDVKFQVEFNPEDVEKYRLIGYSNRVMANKDFNDDTKDGGEIGAGHTVTALYELILDEDSDDDILDLSIRFKRPSSNKSELLTYPVDYRSYKEEPGDDFYFQSAVAQFGLIASHSEYPEDASIRDVKRILKSIDLNDEYKEEFYELICQL